jgi:membrane protease YdiL (CAAX protease family)
MTTKGSSHRDDRPLTAVTAAMILGAVIIAYGSNFWPERLVLKFGMDVLGHPQYAGFMGIFLPHLLLYSTVIAMVSGLLWWASAHHRLLPSPQLANFGQSAVLGFVGGLTALILTLTVVWSTFPAGTVHWIAPAPWKVAGNVFSNFFEEFVFRGFLLVALRRLIGFWAAALVSSAMWAFLHAQYPMVLQISILAIGVGFCWLARRANSLWAPYVAHELLDLLGDSLIG